MTPVVRSSPQDDDSSLALGLDQELIVETISGLQRRIEERFPESGLGGLCANLLTIGLVFGGRLVEEDDPGPGTSGEAGRRHAARRLQYAIIDVTTTSHV